MLVLLFFAAACSGIQTAPAKDTPMPDSPMSTPIPDPALATLAEGARKDLAGRLGIPVEEIKLSRVESVTWPDSSLGCPQPGMAYSQVLTRGYLVVLEARGSLHEYHSGRDGKMFYCESPVPPVSGEAGDTWR
jgi:hypothetical protein